MRSLSVGGQRAAIPGQIAAVALPYALKSVVSKPKLSPGSDTRHPIVPPIIYARIINTVHKRFIGKFFLPSLIRTATVTAGLK